MRISHSPLRQQQYTDKLRLVDSYIQKRESKMSESNKDYEFLLSQMALKLIVDPPSQIQPFTNKSVIFDNFTTKYFVIRQQTAPKQKNFILNINTHVPAKIIMKIDEASANSYHLHGNKAIQIVQQSFNNISITAIVQKTGIFSQIKFYLDLIQVVHKTNKKANINLRPKIDKELEQYLIEKRGKSAEIIRSRSLARIREMTARKTTTAAFRPVKTIEMVRSKSQFQHFQKKKSLYIQHVRKMSPQKMKIIEHHQFKYFTNKKQQIKLLSLLIYVSKLSIRMHQERVKLSAFNLKKMKITMLCLDFIKIIKNKFRLKMTEKARLRMTLHHTVNFLPTFMIKPSKIKARRIILQALTPYMDYKMIEELGEGSQNYIDSLVKIQNFMKLKIRNIDERIKNLIERLIVSLKISITDKAKSKSFSQFKNYCKKRGVWTAKIYSNKQRLIQILRNNAS